MTQLLLKTYIISFLKDFFQMTKEGVCPKESKQKDHSPRTTGKYARRRQKFYIYSWTPFNWCLRTRAHLIGVFIGGVGGIGECQRVLGFHSIFRFLLVCNSLCSQTSAQFIWRLNFAIEAPRSSLLAKFFRRTIDLILYCWKLHSTLNGWELF